MRAEEKYEVVIELRDALEAATVALNQFRGTSSHPDVGQGYDHLNTELDRLENLSDESDQEEIDAVLARSLPVASQVVDQVLDRVPDNRANTALLNIESPVKHGRQLDIEFENIEWLEWFNDDVPEGGTGW